MTPSRLQEALTLLGETLDFAGAEPVRLLVVGGSALAATGVTDRATYDLDVFARRGWVEGEILDARPLPDSLLEAARKVAEEMGLSPIWVDASVSLFALPLVDYPNDFFSDLEEQAFGPCLSISFLGRAGQIYLKFHAAIDLRRDRRAVDLEDLRKLDPKEEETRRAIAWLRARELLGQSNEEEARRVLKTLGHEHLL